MALPVVGRLAAKVFRDAQGRFISKAKHELLGRQSLITGRFITKTAASREKSREVLFNKLLKGKPGPGLTWVRIADKYPERFGDFSREVDSQL